MTPALPPSAAPPRAVAAVAFALALAAPFAAPPAARAAATTHAAPEARVAGLWRDHPSPQAPAAAASRYEVLLRLDANHAFTLYPPCGEPAAAAPREPVARGVWRLTGQGALHLSGEHEGRHVELDVALRLEDDQLEIATPLGPGRLDRVSGQPPNACTTAR
jgi:hypothetical protein